jgi:ribosomal protein S27E
MLFLYFVFLVFFCGSVVFGVLVGGGGGFICLLCCFVFWGGGGLVFVVCPGCGKLMNVDVDRDGLIFCSRCGAAIIVWFGGGRVLRCPGCGVVQVVGGESIFRCRVCGFVGYVSRVEVEVEVL